MLLDEYPLRFLPDKSDSQTWSLDEIILIDNQDVIKYSKKIKVFSISTATNSGIDLSL